MADDSTLFSVPKLESYSEKQIQEFSQHSTISNLYFKILENPELDEIYRLRHTSWLEVALANHFELSNQKSRSFHWSTNMDHIVTKVFDLYFEPEDKVLVLALGKYGSQVLNLSSDIDIILLTDQAISNDLLKKVRSFVQHLNIKSNFGFLTRVDLNLKPSDQTGPLINSIQLTNYLWNSSELWERLVYTRARKICGHLNDETLLLNEIKKFCYRKYIRLDLVEGLSELLSKILNNNNDPSNIKLCPGGIRSIEILLSAIQLLYGGRDSDLQTPYTYDLFDKLHNLKILSNDQIKLLLKNYNILRTHEDKIQMDLDSQSHTLSNIDCIQLNLSENKNIIDTFLKTLFKKNNPKTSELIEKLKGLSETQPHLNDFLRFLNKHSAYIALFDAHPKAYKNLLKALIYSPQVSKLILLRPDLLDMFLIQKEHFSTNSNDEEFLISLSDFKSISQITAIGEFLTEFDIKKFNTRNTKTADFCVSKILDFIFKDENVDILKLGKWSSDELGVFSDLDFVFIYDGKSDLSKQARKFISYLTHNTFHGPFYNIDLRLRPSEASLPILTSYQKLISFLDTDAPVWFRQSYLRNYFLKAKSKIKYNLQLIKPSEMAELVEIRSKRLKTIRNNEIFIKDSYGGIIDVEFFVQCLFLNANKIPENNVLEEQINELVQLKILDQKLGVKVNSIYETLRLLEQLSDIIFKSTKLNAAKFDFIYDVQKKSAKESNAISKLDNLNTFNDLIELFYESKLIIEENHPFLKVKQS